MGKIKTNIMTILLKHPITEKPEKPGEYWFKMTNKSISKHEVGDYLLSDWNAFMENICECWYEEIELSDDAIIVKQKHTYGQNNNILQL